MISDADLDQILQELLSLGTDPETIMRAALDKFWRLSQRYPGKHNILILNMRQHDRTAIKLDGEVFHHARSIDLFGYNLHYGVWIFKSGTVDHTRCDGGWVNWGMKGDYTRSGHQNAVVVFHA